MTDTSLCADLHLHTHASDGALSPSDVVRDAVKAGMTHIAVTDHDTAAGVAQAQAAGREAGIVVLPGIELSCGHGEEVHVLGYGIDLEDRRLADYLAGQMQLRQDRMQAMLARLAQLGMPVDVAEVRSRATGFLGRMNLADAMMRHGYVDSIQAAFLRYLNPGRPAYVPRERTGVAEGVALLKKLGGVPVLAHPGRQGVDFATLTALLPQWIEAGLEGIEAYHASHDVAARDRYDRMVRRYGLLATGGSDSHSRPTGPQIGDHLAYWPSMQDDVQRLLDRLPRE